MKVLEGGFFFKDLKKFKEEQKERLVPKQLTLLLEMIEDAPHRCTTKKEQCLATITTLHPIVGVNGLQSL
jgi:hypothetical protein